MSRRTFSSGEVFESPEAIVPSIVSTPILPLARLAEFILGGVTH